MTALVYITADLSGKDAAVLSEMYRLNSGLEALQIYKDAPEQLAPPKVKGAIDNFQHFFEGGKTGNHADIAQRILARKEAIALFRKVIRYLEIIATEDDIPALIQAGFTVRKLGGGRKKSSVLQPA